MKRILAILLAATMLLSFAACGGGDGSDDPIKDIEFTEGYDEEKYNAPGEFPIFKEKQTITVMLPDSQFVEDWDTNFQTLMMEEDLNADLVIEAMPSKEYTTKVNLMAASGGDEFKDAIIGSFSDDAVITYADSGVIADLTSYYYNKDIAYYSYDGIERLGWNFFPQITMPDGRIYYIADINDSVSTCYPEKMFIYKPWADAMGIDLDAVKTRDDFKDMLSKLVKGDPNGNGKLDEVGIISSSAGTGPWFKFFMNSFVYAGDKSYMLVEDGELSFAFTRDEWKEGIKFMKGMYDDGLISPLCFSQDRASLSAMLNASTTIVAAHCTSGMGGINENDKRRVEYYGIAPLYSDYAGRRLSTYKQPYAKAGMLVNAKAADIENTFRFGDYMDSLKVSIHSRWGEEGVDWLRPQEGDIGYYEAIGYKPYLKEVLVWSTVQNKHWYATGPSIRQKEISGGMIWSGNPLDHSRTSAEAQLRYQDTKPDEYITKLIYTEDEREIVSESLATLLDYVDEMSAKYITGAEDIDATWENFQTQIEKIGATDIIECAQAAYDRTNESK